MRGRVMMILATAVLAGSLLASGAQARGGGGGGGHMGGGFGGGHIGGGFGGGPSARGWLDTLTNYAYGSLSTPFEYDVHETFVGFLPKINTYCAEFLIVCSSRKVL